MSHLDWLWQAEDRLAQDPDADLLAELPNAAAWTEGDCVELAALQLSRGKWSSDRIRIILARYQAVALPTGRWPEVVRFAYQNRVADRTAGSWSDVTALGLPAESLRLNQDGECGWLGQLLLDRYQLEARIGRGALAVVYRAADRATGGWVAVKLPVHESLASIIGSVFRREAEDTRRVEHPRVPRILAYHDHEPVPLIIVQLIEGETLADWQRGRPLDPESSTAIVLQLLEPLAVAHERGIVHRDLSPANILTDARGQIWLTDWNASLREDELASRDGDYSGTPGYASQEGLFGLTARIDPRSDLWSVGAVYYELLTGVRLDAVADRAEAIVHSGFFAPEGLAFPDSVPERVRQVCRKALQPNPALRYGTAEEFRRDLSTPEPAAQRVRWVDVFEMGHSLGQVRRCWLLFSQHLRSAEQTDNTRQRLRDFQTGVAQMIQADQTMLEMTELAGSVGLLVTSEPIPDWLSITIYRPGSVTPDWLDRLKSFAADSDRTQTRVREETESRFVGDEMRAVFRLGYLIPCSPIATLRTELTESPLLRAIPDAVRQVLAELLDQVISTTPNPADVPTLLVRRIREWIRAHQEALAG